MAEPTKPTITALGKTWSVEELAGLPEAKLIEIRDDLDKQRLVIRDQAKLVAGIHTTISQAGTLIAKLAAMKPHELNAALQLVGADPEKQKLLLESVKEHRARRREVLQVEPIRVKANQADIGAVAVGKPGE